MNKRIEELAALADQHMLTYIVGTDVEIDSAEFNAVKLEKFAELIVQECARHVVNRGTHNDVQHADTVVAEHYKIVYSKVKYTIALELHELFGIEE